MTGIRGLSKLKFQKQPSQAEQGAGDVNSLVRCWTVSLCLPSPSELQDTQTLTHTGQLPGFQRRKTCLSLNPAC